MEKILVVDDDPQLRQSFERILQQECYHVLTAASAENGIAVVRSDKPDLVIMDFRLPGMTGLEGYKEIQKIDAKLPVIIMTAFGTTDTAIEATKLGAFDYIVKPFDIPDILELIKKGLESARFMRSTVQLDATLESSAGGDVIIGRSTPMQDVYKAIGRVAPTDATVLIRGESGTGKELAARAIYQHSLRNERPFLIINCVAIPETLLESELFGYEKGAFTGATTRKVGKIEQANGGTVFLDEIGDMPLSIQAKILRLLQERSIERLGGRHPIPVDVRVIAATNRDLETSLSKGAFREDLYYRLKVVTLNLPPLRNRESDIKLLADYFLHNFSLTMNGQNPGITQDGVTKLQEYPWPGNVRELSNAIQKALIFNRGCPLTEEEIDKALSSPNPGTTESHPLDIQAWTRQSLCSLKKSSATPYSDMMDRMSATIIGEALRICRGNHSKTAKYLGISRPTLLAKIDKLDITTQTVVAPSPKP
ncbi:sigma-54-dependent transcriptional regulator [Desulfoplanes sp.]